MTTRAKKTPDECKKEALTVLVQWRGADRASVSDKSDDTKKRIEYQCRKNLRDAADKLTEVHHG